MSSQVMPLTIVSQEEKMFYDQAYAFAKARVLPHVREMDFTGRPLRGYVYVDAEGIERDEDLAEWVGAGLAFVGTLPAKQR